MFYFNPKTPLQGRRGDAPTGHLTQMLWKQSTLVGCARTMKLVKQPKGKSCDELVQENEKYHC